MSDASIVDAPSDVSPSSCANGVVQIAATGSQPDTIALDGEWVYWHEAAGVFRAKKTGGGGIETLAQGPPDFWPDLAAFAVAGGHVAYHQDDAITIDGATILMMTVSPGFASSSSHFFVWSRAGVPSSLVRMALDGTSQMGVALLQHEPIDMTFTTSEVPCVAEDPGVQCGEQLLSGLTATDIAVSGDDVWFTSNDSTNGARVMHLVMPSLKTAPIDDTKGAFALAQDDSALFFTDGLNLRVRRIEGKTGPVKDIASDPGFGPIDIVVDETCVYWTASSRFDKTGTGVVMAAPKK